MSIILRRLLVTEPLALLAPVAKDGPRIRQTGINGYLVVGNVR